MNNTLETIKCKTEHYSFNLKIEKKLDRYGNPMSYHFLVGNDTNPCLSLYFFSKEAKETFGPELIKVANIINIKNLKECVLDNVSNNIYENNSFAKELLDFTIQYIRTHYPHIQRFKLNDKSYIPCGENDTLDLITYSIALHGKTWYELNYNAYLHNNTIYKQYQTQLQKFNSSEFKKQFTWDMFCLQFLPIATDFTKGLFSKNNNQYRQIFEESSTFPDFFMKLNRTIQKKDKCKFYKFWLEQFISQYVTIIREWYFDIVPKTSKGGGQRIKTVKR